MYAYALSTSLRHTRLTIVIRNRYHAVMVIEINIALIPNKTAEELVAISELVAKKYPASGRAAWHQHTQLWLRRDRPAV